MYKESQQQNELAFMIFNIEPRMDFYLWVVKKFCNRGMSVFSVFVGGKVTCATFLSKKFQFTSGQPNLHICFQIFTI